MAKDYSNYRPLSWMESDEPVEESVALTETQRKAAKYAELVNAPQNIITKPLLIRPAWYAYDTLCNHVIGKGRFGESYCSSKRLVSGSMYCVEHDHLYQPLAHNSVIGKKNSGIFTLDAVVAGIVIPGVLVMVCGLQAFSLRNFIAWAILMILYNWIIWSKR